MTRTLLRRALPAGALLLTLAVAACGDGHSTGHSSAEITTSASPGAVFNDADVAFAEHMTVHHQQAVVMSALAGERAAAPRVKELAATIEAAKALAAKIVTDQQAEIATMKALLQPCPHASGAAGSFRPRRVRRLVSAGGRGIVSGCAAGGRGGAGASPRGPCRG